MVEHKAWLNHASLPSLESLDITLLGVCYKSGGTLSARYAQRCTVNDVAAVSCVLLWPGTTIDPAQHCFF